MPYGLIETDFLEGSLPKMPEMVYIAVINDALMSTKNHRRKK
jgi:hypothetical protein